MQATVHKASARVIPFDGLIRWRRAIAEGNRAFEHGAVAKAIRHYRHALNAAAGLLGRIDDAQAGIAALVVAHHNLADAYERLGLIAEQRRHLCEAHERLCAAMADASLHDSWRQAAQDHARRTYAELTRFLMRHPGDSAALAACRQGAAGAASPHPPQ